MNFMEENELSAAIARFVGAFEEVFERDWWYTKANLSPYNIEFFIKPDGTFINPGVEDEVEDWGARAELLESYRDLLSIMKKSGIKPLPPFE